MNSLQPPSAPALAGWLEQPPVIVPVEELSFAWDHGTKPSTCTIRHGGRVVRRGSYDEVSAVFDAWFYGEADFVEVTYEGAEASGQKSEVSVQNN